MKKWFFSNNGEVTAPFDLDGAKDYLASNPNVYGWHPSFTQWKPVNCISEFADILPVTVQAPLIPKEISDKFIAKKQRLVSKLASIDDSINHSQSSLGKFEKQIEDYKTLTQNLNDNVKDAIDNIEKKHKGLNRKLSQVKDAVHIAGKEMTEVVDDFDRRMSSNDIFMPSCKPSALAMQDISTSESDEAQISKSKLAQEKLATPHKRVDIEEAKAEQPIETVKATPVPDKKITPPDVDIQYGNRMTVDVDLGNRMAAESINSMKNMMKSVFKGDKKVEKAKKPEKVEVKTVEVNKSNDQPLSMAERLKMAQNNH
ncbi:MULTISPECIES: DUF4339 domain-containing protein [Colwellia]|uniref:GYF domain-containing protein n=1 Tax=Colwellia psychrerythraea (strain 34H / ATCC BAA-681) TaxID=167879 RepID=Q482L2_COLP3|nr:MULTISPECIES: DUF4339 domain-containing protein [Colwellia]AAZ25037.1 hypothetical protein CPS_2285 [Colwellia psychrerythraea 34H]PKH87824.1 hypothetical protein CXF79_14435 [Colwellia sp. Bg11-28]